MADKATDYLAVISNGVAGSYARDADKEKAIKSVAQIFKRDFCDYYKVKKGNTVTINVIDVAGHDTVWWDNRYFYVGDTKLDRPVECVTHTY